MLVYFAGFFILCLGVVALRNRPSTARAVYRVALLLATLPYLLHVRYTWGWVSGFGDPHPRIGVYPGLVAFAASGVVAAVALVTLAWVVLRRVPVATAALPVALWFAYWFGSLRLISWRAPDFVPVDNKPLIWLFAFSAVASGLLAISLLVGLRRSAPDEWRVVLALLAWTGGACGRSGDERLATDSVASAAAPDTVGLAPVPAESPLAAYPGFGRERDPDEARYRRQQIALHRYIAHCMQRAGFEYTTAPAVVNAPAPPDPNKPYVASLSHERRTRYNLRLYGVPDPNDEGNLWDPRSDTGGGCWGEGMRAIRSVFKARSELMTPYLAMQRAIALDPRVRAGEQRWSACMQSRGFSFARPQSIPARQDSAALRGGGTPELERHYRRATEAAPECVTAVGLDSIKADVRVEKEAEFVRAHKHVLDRHLELLRNQQRLVDSLLEYPPLRD